DDVTGRRRRQIVHQSGYVVARFEHHQAAGPVERFRGLGNGVGELAVGELLGLGEDRQLLAVSAKVGEKSVHVSRTPLPTTSIRPWEGRGGGLRLCWRTMSGGASPAGSMVNSTSWPRNSAAITVPTPSSRSLSETTVATSCSGRSMRVAGPSAP